MNKENAVPFLQMSIRISRHITDYEIKVSAPLHSWHCFRHHSKCFTCANKTPHISLGGGSLSLLSALQMKTWEGCLWDASQLGIGFMMDYHTSFFKDLSPTSALCILPLRGLQEQSTRGWSAYLLFLEEARESDILRHEYLYWMDFTRDSEYIKSWS